MADVQMCPSIGSVPNHTGGHSEIANAKEVLSSGAPMCLMGRNDNRDLLLMMRLGDGRVALAATAMKNLVKATAHLIQGSPDLRQLMASELERHDAEASESEAAE